MLPLKKLPYLKNLSIEAQRKFVVTGDGSYLRWMSAEIDLDLETIRTILDPDLLEQKMIERLRSDKRFGSAIAILRRKHNLRQSDIPGLSDRQVRRIEGDQRARIATLELLAATHLIIDLPFQIIFVDNVPQLSRLIRLTLFSLSLCHKGLIRSYSVKQRS